MRLPFNGRNRITQSFSRSHIGLDIVGDDDKAVRAVQGGVVRASTIVTNKANKTWEWGNYVKVVADDGTQYFYCHLDSRAVKAGQQVNEGDVIGIMGNTGYSFGAHLHLQIRDKVGKELNVAEHLGLQNKIGTYTSPSPTKSPSPTPSPKLFMLNIGPVTNGDKIKFELLAKELNIPYIVS